MTEHYYTPLSSMENFNFGSDAQVIVEFPRNPKFQDYLLIVPCVVATTSSLLLIIQSLWAAFRSKKKDVGASLGNPELFSTVNLSLQDGENLPKAPSPLYTEASERVFFERSRIIGCVMLFALSALDVVRSPEVIRIVLSISYLYCCLISVFVVVLPASWKKILAAHLNLVLLSLVLIYGIRDILPLATYNTAPVDIDDGWILWTRVGLLGYVGAFVPLAIPRSYIPLYPNAEELKGIPEQTASIWSLLTFSFLDSTVLRGYRQSSLAFNEFPPLADYDYAQNLKLKGEQYFGSNSNVGKSHIFFTLLQAFWGDFVLMSVLLVCKAATSFAAPVGINRLLRYLEPGGGDTNIRPWFWILWLLLGPTSNSIANQSFEYISIRTVTQIRSIITQLLFDHSLKLRVKAEVDHHADSSNAESPSNVTGKINSLITTDMQNIEQAIDFMSPVLYLALHIGLAMAFLYVVLGWSSFVGIATFIILFPVPGLLTSYVSAVEKIRMQKTDTRVQNVTETLNVLRMIKLFGWERKVSEDIDLKRKDEMLWIRKRQILKTAKSIISAVLPTFSMFAMYGTYSKAVFDILQGQIDQVLNTMMRLASGKVSLDRVDDFLRSTELLDEFSSANISREVEVVADIHDTRIGFKDAKFMWSKDNKSTSNTVGHREFYLQIDGELVFERGSCNLIVGPSGSGKTSLLMALLGEMHFVRAPGRDSWFNLPRESGVAYAAQESWVLNDTIKNNIIFGADYDEERYKQVLNQCCLEPDLEAFEAGDLTEVGEKGLTLSGGQKARVTLARAIYSSAQILLLDDMFAALDVHTAKWIVEKCFSGSLVRNRTILLVTHNVPLASKVADFVVTLDSNGKIVSRGPAAKELERPEVKNLVYGNLTSEDSAATQKESESKVEEPKNGKLIATEEKEVGRVKWGALNLYLSLLGGDHYIRFILIFLGGNLLSRVLGAFLTWYLGLWASQYDTHPGYEVPVLRYLTTYLSILVFSMSVYCLTVVAYLSGSLGACRIIHKRLMDSILGSTLRWQDVTPISRIIARCTQDIGTVDGQVANLVHWISEITFSLVVKLVAIFIISPVFLGPGIFFAGLGAWVCQVYMASQLSVKRELSNATAPVINEFTVVASGLPSVRAYEAQKQFSSALRMRLDQYMRSTRTLHNLERWITIRMDAISSVFSSSLAAYLVYSHTQNASNIGFSIIQAVTFNELLLFWISIINELEIEANSLERIKSFLEIKQEPKATKSGIPPAHWPSSGELLVENLSAKYFEDGPEILHNISFKVNSGEHVGIVGRTGSGKSTLSLSLLRAIETTGVVYYDGIPTNSVNLDILRSNVTIIPQVPEMLRGTLRQNLDPFGAFDDELLNDALRSSGLFSLQEGSSDVGKITLDTPISSSGSNLSVGQRQIIALARAIVRGSKLLILDEATSAIDHKTDSIIQTSLRHDLRKDVTLLVVAHRLHTIMDADKIMVLDSGRIVEFDTPETLLKNPKGFFRALVDESGDKDGLLAKVSRK